MLARGVNREVFPLVKVRGSGLGEVEGVGGVVGDCSDE